QLLCLRQGRADRLVTQQRRRHVPENRVPVRAVAAQLPAAVAMTHDSVTPSLAQRSDDRGALFGRAAQRCGRPVLEAHAEAQTVALEHLLDLAQRLLAEVRRAQQLDL